MIGVTGCAGFIGSSLAEKLLNNGGEVRGVDNFEPFYPKEIKLSNLKHLEAFQDFHFVEGDLTDTDVAKSFLKDIDVLYHIAGTGGVKFSVETPSLYFRTNVVTTFNLLNEARNFPIKKFVYASSSSVYGNLSNSDLPVKETHVCSPASPYGWSKLTAETCCAIFDKTYSIPTISLRYFTVYGPRQRPDEAVHTFVQRMLVGKELEVYDNGEHLRSLTFIDDAVNATILAGNSEVSNEVFNIGSGDVISVNHLVEIISSVLNIKPKIKYVDSPKGVVNVTHADISKAKKMLDYRPQTSLKDGISRFFEWYKRNKVHVTL